ncbi:DNA-deoxyinosine glycosylase [Eubacterium oxidoreducens]|uniref:G/U mismatch-specific uracil-DNA glycosylase n=1 Tax=Eubacterium oxidoreducens TaxID=1732 RepID=A0A1G6A5L2_EUBOX|nr:DNA-deoxyinosine glycosylase [Eubacterium oxidoreducens]SDB03709.1 G/U mismatch-specific uracil-DNA glycosylase [Eubacterium oxidoreducens]
MNSKQMVSHGFGPVFDEDSKVLILGSFPSVKSREQSFYYGHPQNRFWKVMAAVLKAPLPVSIEEKKAFLIVNHIAVYDVIESCSIIGSSDSSIRDVTVTDLSGILKHSKVGSHIYANGAKAYDLYRKYTLPVTGIEAVKLPSTSPANAAWSLERLIGTWEKELRIAIKKDR